MAQSSYGRPVRNGSQWLLITIILVALALLVNASYIHIKAAVGQYLIHSSWQQTIVSGVPDKPWSWADTWPVAQLQVSELGIDQIVLAGDSGQSLAFGPGHNNASAMPGEPGVAIISGHRDTHFHFLQQLQPGQVIVVNNSGGDTVLYRVTATEVFDTRAGALRLAGRDAEFNNRAGYEQVRSLLLVTCWPFDGVQANTPWRYLVAAEAVVDVARESASRGVI